ncbi:hypothetical protein [Emticicia sp. SJ17W-69]|uniref:hypothetical protein n=1 Tax=Emticicia sp. SJ17W-69 TaxID=3421657 RepID=UPI003EBC3706
MKKRYSHVFVYFAVITLLNFATEQHLTFAKDTPKKEILPLSNPKPIKALPFKPLPFKTFLPNVELYEFNPKALAFDNIVGMMPILNGKELKAIGGDPIKFTLTPNKTTAQLGEEIELTLTAELMDVSPQLLFTFDELRDYTMKVILPKDFILTGGTYYDFVSGTLDPANPKKQYTLKGRFLDKPAVDDCFKVLRKLNNEVFILKNTTCMDVNDIDVVSVVAKNTNAGRIVLENLDLTKIKLFTTAIRNSSNVEVYNFGISNGTLYMKCLGLDWNTTLRNQINIEGIAELKAKGGSITGTIYFYQFPNSTIASSAQEFVLDYTYDYPVVSNSFLKYVYVYNFKNSTGFIEGTTTQTIIFDKDTPCPTATNNILSITANETTICPGNSSTLAATGNCPAANISWQRNGTSYGTAGSNSFSTIESGTYTATCSNPVLTSNSISIVSTTNPSVPQLSTNKYAITPGEFATLSATNCQGTVIWHGPNNFEDSDDQISTNKPGTYYAICRAACSNNTYFSDPSGNINITLLPLRLQADKYEMYANETAQISAFGCNNGFISWKVNGTAIPNTDNPLTAYGPGTYQAQCTSFNGPSSDWVTVYISQKTTNSPRVTASKTQAYPSDNVVLTASGCPSGWFYAWQIPVHDPVTNAVTVQRWVGNPQTVKGPETYKVQCVLQGNPDGPFESINITPLSIYDINITITPNKTEVNPGETVIFTATGNCPNGAGIRWFINGMNYWTWVGQTFQATGPGTYSARCESGYQKSELQYYTINTPKPGAVSIIADKPRVRSNEVVTLRAVGCDKEVNWTLPNGIEVQGTALLMNYGPGIYKAKCVRFGFTSDPPASINITPRNADEPAIVGTNASINVNELAELSITNCPNNWVGWKIPVKDANGNITYQYTSNKTQVIREPGIYYYHCAIGNYTEYIPLVIHPAPTDALVIKASKTVAKPDEQVVLTAYGCPNGTVQWSNGNQTATGTRITVLGPGLRKAKCVGDYSNNGDWAMAFTRNDGEITPYLTASVTEACPNEPVTITATGCPNGWWYQTQWVKPGQLDYWLTHRQQVDDFGEGYFDVFGFGGGTINTNGPNIYYARCISPDGGWMGDFRDKSVIINPAFPTDLRVSNNGPALTGAASVSLAVTEVPNASYAWRGPNAFVSAARSPIIQNPTEAKSGIYTVTLKRGTTESWACSTTATTKLTVSGCDIRIKASDPNTGVETYVLPFVDGSISTFKDLTLSAERYDGTDPQGMTYTWTKPDGTTISTAYIITNKSGRYSLSVSPIGNPSIVCKAFITISESNAYKMLFSKMKSKIFPDGTPVKVVPLQYKEMYYTLTRNGVEEKIDIAENYLLFYTSAGVKKVDMMQVIPTYDYNRTHSVVNDADFSGLIVFTEKDGKTFKKGWRFNNGVVNQTITTTNIHQARLQNPNDDCVIKQYATWTTGTASVTVENRTPQINGGGTDGTYTATSPEEVFTIVRNVLNIDCCLIAPAGCGPNNPSAVPPFGSGGGGLDPQSSDIAKKICPQYTTLLGEADNAVPKTQILNKDCASDLAAATRFSIYAKLIDESVKKEFAKNPTLQPYINKMTPATDAQINAAYNESALYGNDAAALNAVGCALTQNFQADAAHPITPDVEDVMSTALANASNDVKVVYNALTKLLNPCSSSQNCAAPKPQAVAVMNTIMASMKSRKGAVLNGFQWSDFGDRLGMEAGDIKNLFNDLLAASGDISIPDPSNPNIQRLLPLSGPFANIDFTYNATTNQLDIRNCNNTISMMDATVPPPMNDCMAVIPNNGRIDLNPIYPFVKESFLNTLTQRGETMQGMGIVGCNTCTLTNKGDWGENTYWLFKNSDGNNYWIAREMGTTNYRYAYDADPTINNNDNLQWTSWEPDFGEEVTAGAKFSQNTALAFAGTLGVIVSAPVIVGTVVPALIQSASTITLQGVMEEVIINTMLSLATDGNINPVTLSKETVDGIFTDKLIEKIPALVGKKFQIPIKTFNVLKDWLIKKGTNTVSLSYLQNIKTIAKPFTDKVVNSTKNAWQKIDDLCASTIDKLKVFVRNNLFDNIYNSQKNLVLTWRNNISTASNLRKGNFGEMASDALLTEKGFLPLHTRLDNIDAPTRQGIDGVFKKGNDYYIVEAKYRGTAGLSTLTNGTKQMSDTWINSRLLDAVGATVTQDINARGYKRLLANVAPDGSVTYSELDSLANIIGSFTP